MARKAWKVYGQLEEWCLLVFAKTRGRAKSMLVDHEGFDYCYCRANRVPIFDDIADSKGGDWIAYSNSDLPNNRRFYTHHYSLTEI